MLAGLKYLLRVLDTSPGHLGNVKQTVRAAKVDERAEIGHILNGAFYGVAYMDALEQFFLHRCLPRDHKLLSVADHSALSRVKLGNDKLDLLTGVFCQVSLVSIGYQARRDKYPRLVNHHAQAAV